MYRSLLPRFILILGCVLLLISSPDHWRFGPDSGIYVGGAIEMVEHQRYWLNGYPNLIYYPGTSLVLAPILALFGLDYQLLQLLMILLGCAVLLCCYRYYHQDGDEQFTAMLLLFVFCNKLFLASAMAVSSTIVFTFLVLLSFVFWQRFQRSRRPSDAWFCLAIVAFAPLVRMEGVFLAMSYSLALLVDQWPKYGPRVAAWRAAAASLISALPFMLWTVRNYMQYHPEAFNRIGQDFFNQPSIPKLRVASSFGLPEDARWEEVLAYLSTTPDALVDKIIHFRIGEFIAPSVSSFAWLTLLAMGCSRWVRRAHLLEISFVTVLAAFLIHYQINQTLDPQVIARYWTPLLPSLLAIALLGFGRIFSLAESPLPRSLVSAMGLGILLLALNNSVADFKYFKRSDSDFAEGLLSMQSAAAWVERHTAADELIAVTDWGTMPMLLARPTVLALDDPDHTHTLQLLGAKQPTHLLIVNDLSHATSVASGLMVERYPQIFSPQQEFATSTGMFSAHIYSVNHELLIPVAAELAIKQAAAEEPP